MSLIRQLWLAVIISALVGFAGSLLVSVWSAQQYLTEQLTRKNNDTAHSLALLITHQEKDPVLLDLQISALFDTGFYQSIVLSDPKGKVIAERVNQAVKLDVPAWFVARFSIESKPGLGLVNDGWRQYGQVAVISHTQFAYAALWQQAKKLFFWFLLGGGACGVAGMLWLRHLGRSINKVVEQAREIENRHFVMIEEPSTPELNALAKAMNSMVARVRQMFSEAATRLEELRQQVDYDTLTRMPNRQYFMAHFSHLLHGDDAVHCGVLLVVRTASLDRLNDVFGRQKTDELLTQMANLLSGFSAQYEGALQGRVKAGEMALVFPGEQDVDVIATRVLDLLLQQLVQDKAEFSDLYHIGVVPFLHGHACGEVLSKVDQALAQAQIQGGNACYALQPQNEANVLPREQWRTMLLKAVHDGGMYLDYYPSISTNGGVLHQEGLVRLKSADGHANMVAGDFMPVAASLNLTPLIDFEVIRSALLYLSHNEGDVAINLSAKSVDNWAFRDKLFDLLAKYPEECPRIWFEVGEYGAFKYFEAFKDVCSKLQTLGCRVGIEQFGQQLSESQRLAELGLNYVKLHPNLVHDLEIHVGTQRFIQQFCELSRAIGVLVIATGATRSEQIDLLQGLGVDGVSGPVVRIVT